jgi:hypothetical protein
VTATRWDYVVDGHNLQAESTTQGTDSRPTDKAAGKLPDKGVIYSSEGFG